MSDKSDIAFLLLSLFYNRKAVKGRTRFQKTIYLLKHKYKIPFGFNFRQYYYGPYSDDLADTLSLLEAADLVKERGEMLGIDVVRYNYELTEKGQEFCRELASKVKKEVLARKLKESVEELHQIQTPELISLSKKIFELQKS